MVICLLSKVRQLYPGRAGFPHECGFLRSKAVGLVDEVPEQSFELQCFGGEDAGGFDGAAAVRASFLPRRRRCRSRGRSATGVRPPQDHCWSGWDLGGSTSSAATSTSRSMPRSSKRMATRCLAGITRVTIARRPWKGPPITSTSSPA